jgi:hypothetical protein
MGQNIIVPGKALSAETIETFPGEKQPCLFLLYAYPPSGASTGYIAGVLHQELEKIACNQVSSDELVPVKKAARVGLLVSNLTLLSLIQQFGLSAHLQF